MLNDYYFVYGKEGDRLDAPVGMFRKSEVVTVTYGFSLDFSSWGCYVNNTIFVPGVTVETFFRDILGEAETIPPAPVGTLLRLR